MNINDFDFDQRKCTPVVRLSKTQFDNTEVMMKGLQYFCMSCRLCSLGCELINEKDKQFDPHVFSNMNFNSKFMVVGQNPGFNECIIGEPFVGKSGQNFDEEIHNNGLSRNQFYITNIIKCWTKNNNKPHPKYYKTCEHILKLEIAIIKPKLIITLGKHSFEYFCPNDVYGDKIGKITQSAHGPIYAIYHPSPLNINDPNRRNIFNKQIRLLSGIVTSIG